MTNTVLRLFILFLLFLLLLLLLCIITIALLQYYCSQKLSHESGSREHRKGKEEPSQNWNFEFQSSGAFPKLRNFLAPPKGPGPK